MACALVALCGSLSHSALISTPSMCDIRFTAPGPRMPKPTKPMRTLFILGAAYPHMLNCGGLPAHSYTRDKLSLFSLAEAGEGRPIARAPVPREILRKNFLLFV